MAQATMMGKGIPVGEAEKSHPKAAGSIPGAVFLFFMRVAPAPASCDGTAGGWLVPVCSSSRPGSATSSVDKWWSRTWVDGNPERSSGSVTSGRLIHQTNSPDLHLSDTKSSTRPSPVATPPGSVAGNFPLHQQPITGAEKKKKTKPLAASHCQKNGICPRQSALEAEVQAKRHK